MPFPESTSTVTETNDTSNMREKLVADAIGKTGGARFPDQPRMAKHNEERQRGPRELNRK